MSAHKTVRLPGPFKMRRGGELPEVELVYETWGKLSPKRDNVLLLCTGLSPGSHARSSPEDSSPGWWEEMIGAGRAIDTDKYFVVCINSLGSCHGSTGPASIDPRTGERYRMSFPELTIEDIATANREALRVLGLDRVKVLVGPSMGGMTALAYSILYPEEVHTLVNISAATHATPLAIAIRSLQREAIRSDPGWKDGNYAPGEPPVMGMRLARKLGVITYRSGREWRRRFGRTRVRDLVTQQLHGSIEFEVEGYLERHAQRFVHSFDANCYLYLSRAIDLFDIGDYGGTAEFGLEKIQLKRALVIGVETDFLFPLDQQRDLASFLSESGCDVQFEALPSIQGHDSFLVDIERFAPLIGRFLGRL